MRFPELVSTERLILRRWRLEDADALKVALDRNKDHLVPWIPWATGQDSELSWVVEQLERMQGEFAQDRNWSWAITLADRPGVVGGCGLHDRIGVGGLEIGYWLDRDQLGRGLASEAASALVELALADPAVDHVEMHVDERNHSSARIPMRLGFAAAERRPRTDRWGSEIIMVIWRLRK
ncbi:MAG TPA: GNAT family N-acetyltransferase [Gemmatimonadales bacterium]|nr:GNAT family N-acetyltransferase [Gemmatimonadales bacterium]